VYCRRAYCRKFVEFASRDQETITATGRDLSFAVNHPVGCKKTGDIKRKAGCLSGSQGQDVTDRGEAVKKR
jgi:hypothetical protein